MLASENRQRTLECYTEKPEEYPDAPEDFVRYVERNFDLDPDFSRFLNLVKNGSKADRSFAKSRNGIKPGDWIVKPYDRGLVSVLRKAMEKGRLVMK